VAYLQLCSVTFAVLGLVAFGCGGNTNTSAGGATPSADEPPANTDQPPSGSDQAPAPTGSDQVPSNPDMPPSNPDAPAGSGGGDLGALCQEFCTSLARVASGCSQGMDSLGMTKVCTSANSCVVPPGIAPCAKPIADLFSCAIDNIALLCTASQNSGDPGQDPAPAPAPQPQTAPCQDVLKTFTKCADDNHLEDTGDNMNMDPRACMTGNACTDCVCKAGTDMTKQQACFTDACATPAP